MGRVAQATAVRELRREAFVDTAQHLIQTKGYEQMTVQDVLDELAASRGAFYHYFDSKLALLEAVVERTVTQAMDAIGPVVADPHLSAVEKLSQLFSGIASWKTQRKELMLALLQVWYSDDNALVRDKVRQGTTTNIGPLLAAIVQQGKAEGVFSVRSPEDTARVIVCLLQGAQDLAGELFFARQAGSITFESVEGRLDAHEEALERVLGVPPGTLQLVAEPILREWFG